VIFADRVKDTTVSVGTGAITLGNSAPTGYQTFATAFGVSPVTVAYCIADQAGPNWEVGSGTFDGTTGLTRTTVLASSNAGALVSFTAGTKDVFCTAPAAYLAPSGATTQIPYSNGNTYSASSTFTYTSGTNTLGVGNITGSNVPTAAWNIAMPAPSVVQAPGAMTISTASSVGVFAGGALNITTGAAGAGNVNGGALNITTGAGGTSGLNGKGGAISLSVGAGFRGGAMTLTAGATTGTNGGGTLTLSSGYSGVLTSTSASLMTLTGSTSTVGGSFGMTGGISTAAAGAGGGFTLQGGRSDGAGGTGGSLTITGGASTLSGTGGGITFTSGPGSVANGTLTFNAGAGGTVIKIQDDLTNAQLGFFAATPVVCQASAAASTDLATVITLANALRTAMLNYGLIV
jgi:hypothetical protein